MLTSQEVMTNHSTTLRLAGLVVAASMFCAVMPTEGQEAKPVSPANLPGKGLAQHDFFYAGEAKTQDMYIVDRKSVV